MGGVCGGIAESWEFDVSAVRLIVVLVALITAIVPVLLAYVILWAVIPVED